MLILAAGMPRAGSGWHYNLVHDLVVAAGGADARAIRTRWLLAPLLTEVNCNIGTLSAPRLFPVQVPSAFGKTFAIKTHSEPRPFAEHMLRKGTLRVSYIYRDPRAALLSAIEYGERARIAGRDNAFARLMDFEAALKFMLGYVKIWQRWMAVEGIHRVRYEDLLEDYAGQAARLAAFLGADPSDERVSTVIEGYRPEAAARGDKGLHFQHGEPQRWRGAFGEGELNRVNEVLGGWIEKMGYST